MRTRFFLNILTVFAVVIALSSCQKNNQDKLIGTWDKFENPQVGDQEKVWVLTATDVTELTLSAGDTVSTLEGTYILKNNTLTIAGEGTSQNGGDLFRGDFEIESLTDSELVLLRQDSGQLYYEFTKK